MLYERLKRDGGNKKALNDLSYIYDEQLAKRLLDRATGDMLIRSHPVMWHPAQANWCFQYIPELRPLLHEISMELGIVLTNFSQHPVEIEQEWVDDILGKNNKESWEVFLGL
jgi:hypothetical protein